MAEIKVLSPNTKILCPNHGCPLEGCGFPLPKRGTGTCPVSGAEFSFVAEFDEEKDKITKDKNGNLVKQEKWKLTGND